MTTHLQCPACGARLRLRMVNPEEQWAVAKVPGLRLLPIEDMVERFEGERTEVGISTRKMIEREAEACPVCGGLSGLVSKSPTLCDLLQHTIEPEHTWLEPADA